ncbi:MAG: competence protein ComEA [Motiliproteus sp.]|jgi:competence protein ComEA
MRQGVRVGLLGLLLGLSLQAVAAVDINQASAEQLSEGLNGVGVVKAQEIVRYRELHGPFKSVDQLSAVKGIGEGLIGRNRAVLEASVPESPAKK